MGIIKIDRSRALEVEIRIIENALQNEMERRAVAAGYGSLLSACSYACQPIGSPFQEEGAKFLSWRSYVWKEAHSVINSVKLGERPMPTIEDAISMMPKLDLS